MKVWITKYALTKGIEEYDAPDAEIDGDYLSWGSDYTHGRHFYCVEGREWHRTRESAVDRARAMQADRIKSLEKSIAKARKLTFA